MIKFSEKKWEVVTYVIMLVIALLMIATSGLVGSDGFLPKRDILFDYAKVIEIQAERLVEDRHVEGVFTGYQDVILEVTSGPFQGERRYVNNAIGRTYNHILEEGMEVVVSIVERDGQMSSLVVYSYKRSSTIYFLVGLLFLSLIIVGRWKGFKSFLSLIFTGIIIVFFLIPHAINGMPVVLLTVITASLSILGNFFLLNGWTDKTYTATLGTIFGVVVAAVIAYLAGRMGNVSGIHVQHAEQLMFISAEAGLKIHGFMFAVVIISALGAVMDVGMSISSAAYEIHEKDKNMGSKKLFTSVMNVGKDMIGTMVNTLILVFVGGLLSTLVITFAYGMPYNHFINSNQMAVEMIQGLSGSIGLVLTVPITAFISVVFAGKRSQNTN